MTLCSASPFDRHGQISTTADLFREPAAPSMLRNATVHDLYGAEPLCSRRAAFPGTAREGASTDAARRACDRDDAAMQATPRRSYIRWWAARRDSFLARRARPAPPSPFSTFRCFSRPATHLRDGIGRGQRAGSGAARTCSARVRELSPSFEHKKDPWRGNCPMRRSGRGAHSLWIRAAALRPRGPRFGYHARARRPARSGAPRAPAPGRRPRIMAKNHGKSGERKPEVRACCRAIVLRYRDHRQADHAAATRVIEIVASR